MHENCPLPSTSVRTSMSTSTAASASASASASVSALVLVLVLGWAFARMGPLQVPCDGGWAGWTAAALTRWSVPLPSGCCGKKSHALPRCTSPVCHHHHRPSAAPQPPSREHSGIVGRPTGAYAVDALSQQLVTPRLRVAHGYRLELLHAQCGGVMAHR